jgi:hypothetical protein
MYGCIARARPGRVRDGRVHQNHAPDFNDANQQHDEQKDAQTKLDEALAAGVAKPPNRSVSSQFNTRMTVRR